MQDYFPAVANWVELRSYICIFMPGVELGIVELYHQMLVDRIVEIEYIP